MRLVLLFRFFYIYLAFTPCAVRFSYEPDLFTALIQCVVTISTHCSLPLLCGFVPLFLFFYILLSHPALFDPHMNLSPKPEYEPVSLLVLVSLFYVSHPYLTHLQSLNLDMSCLCCFSIMLSLLFLLFYPSLLLIRARRGGRGWEACKLKT